MQQIGNFLLERLYKRLKIWPLMTTAFDAFNEAFEWAGFENCKKEGCKLLLALFIYIPKNADNVFMFDACLPIYLVFAKFTP